MADNTDSDVVKVIIHKEGDVALLFRQCVAFVAAATRVEYLPSTLDGVIHGILVAGSSGRATDAATLGVGLAGMRERMRQLGGSLSVRSSSRGTCVQARLAVVRAAGARPEPLASL